MAKVIGVLSGKGGVGKTTLSLNLGMAFTKLGEKVTIIDGDFKNPNVGLYLGMYKFEKTLTDFLKKSLDITEVIYEYSGMHIMPTSLSLTDIGIGLSKLKQALEFLEGHVIIDFPPGLTRDTTNLMDICDQFIIVTNPTIPSLASTMRFANISTENGKELTGVVVNKYGKKFEVSKEEIETTITENVISYIPEDDNIRKSAMEKKTVIEYRPYSAASISIMKLASKLLNVNYKEPSLAQLRNLVQSIA